MCQLEFCVPTAQREVTARAGVAVGLRHPLLAPHCVFRQIDRVVFEQKSFCRCLLASLVICFILHMFSLQFYSKCSTRFAPAEILLSISAPIFDVPMTVYFNYELSSEYVIMHHNMYVMLT